MLEINQSLDCWLIEVKHQHRNTLYNPKQAELWSEIQLETLAAPYDFSSLEIAALVNVYVRSSRLPISYVNRSTNTFQWFYKLLILRAILEHADRLEPAGISSIHKLAFKAELEECALHLCRSQEYITLSYRAAADLSIGWHSFFMLRWAAACFAEGERQDKHELVRWCAKVEDYKQKQSFLGRRDWYIMASMMQDAGDEEL